MGRGTTAHLRHCQNLSRKKEKLMPSMGEKFACGGREFWCVGFEGRSTVLLRSGAVEIGVPIKDFDTTFKQVGSMEVGGSCTAKETYGGVQAGETYEVTDIRNGNVTLSNGLVLDLKVFTSVF